MRSALRNFASTRKRPASEVSLSSLSQNGNSAANSCVRSNELVGEPFCVQTGAWFGVCIGREDWRAMGEPHTLWIEIDWKSQPI